MAAAPGVVVEAIGSRIRTWINVQLCVYLDDPDGKRRGIAGDLAVFKAAAAAAAEERLEVPRAAEPVTANGRGPGLGSALVALVSYITVQGAVREVLVAETNAARLATTLAALKATEEG